MIAVEDTFGSATFAQSQDVFGLILFFLADSPRTALALRRVCRGWRVRVESADTTWMHLTRKLWFQTQVPQNDAYHAERKSEAPIVTGGALDQVALVDGWYSVFADFSKRTRALLPAQKPSNCTSIRGCGHGRKRRIVNSKDGKSLDTVKESGGEQESSPRQLKLNDFEFTFECPLFFENLTKLDDRRRYCSTCKECVTTVTNIEELDEVVAGGGCVQFEEEYDDGGSNDDGQLMTKKGSKRIIEKKKEGRYVVPVHHPTRNRFQTAITFHDQDAVDLVAHMSQRALARLNFHFPNLFHKSMHCQKVRDGSDDDSDDDDDDDEGARGPKTTRLDLSKLWIPGFLSTSSLISSNIHNSMRLLLVDYVSPNHLIPDRDEVINAGDGLKTAPQPTKGQFWLRSLSNECAAHEGDEDGARKMMSPKFSRTSIAGGTARQVKFNASAPCTTAPGCESVHLWSNGGAAVLQTIPITGDYSNPDPVEIPEGLLTEPIYATGAMMEFVDLLFKILLIKFDDNVSDSREDGDGGQQQQQRRLVFIHDGSQVPMAKKERNGDVGSSSSSSSPGGVKQQCGDDSCGNPTTTPWYLLARLRNGMLSDYDVEQYMDNIMLTNTARFTTIVSNHETNRLLQRRPFPKLDFLPPSLMSQKGRENDDSDSDCSSYSGRSNDTLSDLSDSFEFSKYEIDHLMSTNNKKSRGRGGKFPAIVTPVDSDEILDEDEDNDVQRRESNKEDDKAEPNLSSLWTRRHPSRRAIPSELRPSRAGGISYLSPFERGMLGKRRGGANSKGRCSGPSRASSTMDHDISSITINRSKHQQQQQGSAVEWVLPQSVMNLIKEATEVCNRVAEELVLYQQREMSSDGVSWLNDDEDDSSISRDENEDEAQIVFYNLMASSVNQLRSCIGRLRQPIVLSKDPVAFLDDPLAGGTPPTPIIGAFSNAAAASSSLSPQLVTTPTPSSTPIIPSPSAASSLAPPPSHYEGLAAFRMFVLDKIYRRPVRKIGKMMRRRPDPSRGP